MDADVKIALKGAVMKSLPALAAALPNFSETHLVWRRQPGGQWTGQHEHRPAVTDAFVKCHKVIVESAKELDVLLQAKHPEHAGFVGSPRFGTLNIGSQPAFFAKRVLGTLWDRHNSFNVGGAEVDAVIQELEDFIDRDTFRVRFQAILLNFSTKQDSFCLPEGLRVRRLAEDEVSSFYGGPVGMPSMKRNRTFGMHEFVIEGEIDEPKITGDLEPWDATNPERVLLDKAMRCLRTCKSGPVGYDFVHYNPRTCAPVGNMSFGYGDLWVPFGVYSLTQEEVEPFQLHSQLMFEVSDAAMEMACSRLSDAEIRARPHDRIVDAVIGMEALLLAGLEPNSRKGELSFRFSLNYGMLTTTPEARQAAFKVAKDLYNLRSTIAHGETLKGDTHRVGQEKLKLLEAANRATDALRGIIRYFLPNAKQSPYKSHEFWQRLYFGSAGSHPESASK